MTDTSHTPGTIYQGYGYTAELVGFKAVNGPILCITRKAPAHSNTPIMGRYLTGARALEWAEHIQTAVDSKEAAALCKAVYHG